MKCKGRNCYKGVKGMDEHSIECQDDHAKAAVARSFEHFGDALPYLTATPLRPFPKPASDKLSDREKIEEAHGIWELTVMRAATLLEVEALANLDGQSTVPVKLLKEAVDAERSAFKIWQAVSDRATAK